VAAALDDRSLLARLVAFDTTSRLSNLPLVDFLSDYLDRPGVRITRNPSADGTKTNLLVALGPETPERDGLILSGHMDVVPAEEPDWRSDPFTLTSVGDRLVGRGASDMKGFLALAANRMAAIDPNDLRAPLVLLFTYDEEVGTLGARRFTQSFPARDTLPRSVIIGEPTELRAVRAHKGMTRFRLGFAGQAAHSGYPHLGRSAIEPAARAIVALAELREALAAERPPQGELFPAVPYTALNVGTVTGGTAVNVIPDRCEIQLGVRVLPGGTAAELRDRIARAVRGAVGDGFALDCVNESPPMMLDERAPVYRMLCEVIGQDRTATVMFGTDAGWLQQAGFDCVLFGPGSIEVAHRANEWLAVAELQRAGAVLEEMIGRSCRRS
jgi:acetylornithine deacetylase